MRKITIIFSLLLSLQLSAATVNFLDVDYYSFEKETSAWWIQHSDVWSISSEKAATGTKALKYSSSTAISATKKVHSSDQSFMFTLAPGTYTLSLKVYIPSGYTGKAFNCIIKDTWINTKVDISNFDKDQWVTFTKELNITESVNNSRLQISIAESQAGIGSFYIDDIKITGEVPDEMPLTSSIHSDNAVNLTAKYYKAKLKVWVEENTDLEAFYTIIDAPYTALKWDISMVNKGTWVELEQDFDLKVDATSATFKITVPNSRGAGAFYVDDISFTETEGSSIIEKSSLDITVYPNPSQGEINIKSPTKGNLNLYSLSGKRLLQKNINEGTNVIDMNTFSKDLYLLRITSNGAVYQERIIIE